MKLYISLSSPVAFNIPEVKKELKQVILDDFGIPSKESTVTKGKIFDPSLGKIVPCINIKIDLTVRGKAKIPFEFFIYKRGPTLIAESLTYPLMKRADNVLDIMQYVRSKLPSSVR